MIRALLACALGGLALISAVSCETDAAIGPGDQLVAEAEALMPDHLAFHARVVARTCGPDGGVCHHAKEYPDLHTPGNMIDVIGKPCNVAEEDPADIADLCEPLGDLLVVTSGPREGLEARIAHHSVVEDAWVVTLDRPITGCAPHRARFEIRRGDGDGLILAVDDPALAIDCDGPTARVPGFTAIDAEFQRLLRRRVRMGDPNGNGVMGRALGGALVVPGDPERSYLLQRVLGTVPGSPMPLANQPLDDRELLAFWCWIATLPADGARADTPIDYGACAKAQQVRADGALALPAPSWQEEASP